MPTAMPIAMIQPGSATLAGGPRAADAGLDRRVFSSRASSSSTGEFASVLSRRQNAFLAASAVANDAQHGGQTAGERARAAAADFVAVSLIEPILKNLRETSQAAAPFGPGPGEKQFRALADSQVARQIAQATRFPLVDALARNLLGLRAEGAAKVSWPSESTTEPRT